LIRASEIELEFAQTGIPQIDTIIRGFKRGGYSILWGGEGSGKTSLVLYTLAQEQRQGKVCLYASIEARFDPGWAASLGIDLDKLLVIERGKSMEDTLMAIEMLIKEGLVDTVAIDSVTALLPQQEVENKKDAEKTLHGDHMAVQAKKFSQWFRRTTPLIAKHNTCMILVGQGRMEGFAQGMAHLGLAGGRAQKYYSSTTLKMYRTNVGAPHVMIGDKKKYIGFVMCVILDKTSLTANEGKEVKLPFVFGVGLDLGRTEVDAAIVKGVIDASSKGYYKWTHPETKVLHNLHGKTKLYEFFGDETLLDLLKQDVEEKE
jgi:recombination protein RecA